MPVCSLAYTLVLSSAALDYVDVVAALKAQPKEASLKKVQAKLKSFVESGQLGPFANGYWDTLRTNSS